MFYTAFLQIFWWKGLHFGKRNYNIIHEIWNMKNKKLNNIFAWYRASIGLHNELYFQILFDINQLLAFPLLPPQGLIPHSGVGIIIQIHA